MEIKTQCADFSITHTTVGGNVFTLILWHSNVQVSRAFVLFCDYLNIFNCLFEGEKEETNTSRYQTVCCIYSIAIFTDIFVLILFQWIIYNNKKAKRRPLPINKMSLMYILKTIDGSTFSSYYLFSFVGLWFWVVMFSPFHVCFFSLLPPHKYVTQPIRLESEPSL